MKFDLWSFILDNFDAAGSIGAYVSLSILGFALISFVAKKKYNKAKTSIGPKWAHPIIGSFLGTIPGCGATIVVASLYQNKKVSFGGLLATFLSTLGEGSFVLLGASNEADVVANLKAYLTITIFGFVAGVIFGYLFDLFGFRSSNVNDEQKHKKDISQHFKQNKLSEFLIEKLAFYIMIPMVIFLAPGAIMALWGGGIDTISSLTYWISVAFTIFCVVFYFVNLFVFKYHDCYSSYNTIKSTLLHAILDIAMVVTFVFIGLLVSNYIIDILIGVEIFNKWMQSSVYVVIFLAAIIGLMPGCGGMIAVAVAFITIPNFPVAALIAAAIATSGDGIFPLLAENKKDAMIVSLVGFVVALFVAYISFALGF